MPVDRARLSVASPRTLAGHVSIDILAFLWGVFLVVVGLQSVGIVDRLSAFYGARGWSHRSWTTIRSRSST
jgi:Na+/H+ antiporter NhaD/arsenite permease-like protein